MVTDSPRRFPVRVAASALVSGIALLAVVGTAQATESLAAAPYVRDLPVAASVMHPLPTSKPPGETAHKSLLGEVKRELGAMRQSRYQHPTDVREATGEFYFDCSGFLDYALARSVPSALRALPVSKGKQRPLAKDVVHHLQRVEAGRSGGPWRSVRAVPQLRAGDVWSPG